MGAASNRNTCTSILEDTHALENSDEGQLVGRYLRMLLQGILVWSIFVAVGIGLFKALVTKFLSPIGDDVYNINCSPLHEF